MNANHTEDSKQSMSSSSFLPSRSSASQRRTAQASDNPNTDGTHGPVLEQAPTPKPIFQFIALGLIVFLGLLQFLPATHFRHPSDPFRIWVPFNSNTSVSLFLLFKLYFPGAFSYLRIWLITIEPLTFTFLQSAM